MRSHAKAVVAVSALLLTLALGASSAFAAAPVVSIDPASEIGVTTAQATGEVNPEGKETSWHFEFISDAAFSVHQDDEQTLTIAATAGAYTLSFQGQSTKAIAFSASAATVEAELNALSTIGDVGGSVSVTGGPGDESGSAPYTIAFGGSLEETNVEQISADPTGLVGSASVETIVQGRAEGFEGATETGFGGFSLEEAEAISGSTPVPPATLEGLAPATEYHLRLVASNEDGSTEAVAANFETDTAIVPSLTADPADPIAYTTATISGAVDPKGGNVNPIGGPVPIFWQLQYALASEPGNWQLGAGGTIEGAEAEGSDPIAVSANLTGLAHDTEYDFRLIANYAGSLEATSSEESFETLAVTAPSVSADEATSVGAFTAHLSGGVEVTNADPAFDAGCNFDYITEQLFDENEANSLPGFTGASSIACNPNSVKGSETQPVTVQADPSQLVPNTTYHLRLRASNLGGEDVDEAPASFHTTAIAPTFGQLAHLQLGDDEVAVTARVNPRNSAITDCEFFYGPSTTYGQTVPCEALPPTDNEGHLVRAELSGLTPGATYHFKLSATSTAGAAESDDASFTVRSAAAQSSCANAGSIGVGFLPECRAWEMVSPPDKHGGNAAALSAMTHAAADGDALAFTSLVALGEVQGTAITTEYISKRDGRPGTNGWSTHGITPRQKPYTVESAFAGVGAAAPAPAYQGDFSADLSRAVYYSLRPLTDAPNAAGVPNLYLREDLTSPGTGSYRLLTDSVALPPKSPPLLLVGLAAPNLAGASVDFSHVIFESKLGLTEGSSVGEPKLYENAAGTVRLVGRVPAEPASACDDAAADPSLKCVEAPSSQAGISSSNHEYSSRMISADGSRILFQAPPGDFSFGGNIYMREDGTRTFQLNASEKDPSEAPSPSGKAKLWDASRDGSRVFFTTQESLVDEDEDGGSDDLYMYEGDKPEGERLTLLSVDHESADGDGTANTRVIGASDDGHYVYFLRNNQLVAGEPAAAAAVFGGLYLWHDGQISYIGQLDPDVTWTRLNTPIAEWYGEAADRDSKLSRLTPDGRHLIFTARSDEGLKDHGGFAGYDHGDSTCSSIEGGPCREIYTYSADSGKLRCASCNPTGAPATAEGQINVRGDHGPTAGTYHQNHALSDDGRYVFFTSAERLVPTDSNGVSDAYVYDTASEEVRLLSSGEDRSGSYFLDASADGRDAFIATAEPLSRWDVDTSYDIYDARIGGGLPEPQPAPPACQGDACQPNPVQLNDPTPASSSFRAPGNPTNRRCPQGKRKVKARGGKSRCVKTRAKRNREHKRDAKHNRRAGR